MRSPRLLTLAGAVAAIAVAATGAQAQQSAAITVGFVTTTAGYKDNGINQAANTGLQNAIAQLGVQGIVTSTGSTNDYIPGLTAFGQQGYNLVIAPSMVGELDQVATSFPKTMFAGIDVSITEMLDAPANYVGILFRTEQSGYLAGYLAGLFIDSSKLKKVASAVGGEDTDEAEAYIAGYVAGVHKADRKIKVVYDWADTVTQRADCVAIAKKQIVAGASVLFSVAGRCGDAALKYASRQGRWGIGFDFDESSLAPRILTTAVKDVDVAVFDTIKAAQTGSLSGGKDVTYGAADGAVGLGPINAKVPASVVKQVQAMVAQMKAGKITNIPTTVK